MKKILTFMLGILLIIPCSFMFTGCKKDNGPKMETWDGGIAEVSAAVDGVITIETAEELAGLAKMVNEGEGFAGKTIKLMCDMDFANREWTPIGYGTCNSLGAVESGYYFKGKFDGQDHTIYNLKITTFNKGGKIDNASAGVALFGHTYQAEIKGLKIENAVIQGNHYVGAVAGFSMDSNIFDCEVENAVIDCVYNNPDDSGDKAGVIVGHFARGYQQTSNAVIENCWAKECSVSADRDAGQVIGCLVNDAINLNNIAEEVTVSWNRSSEDVLDYDKGNKNINNTIVGRIA